QLLELNRLPDAQARQDRHENGREHGPVEQLLHRIVLAEPMVEREAERREEVAGEGADTERQEIAAKVPRNEADDEVSEIIKHEHPHGTQMPNQPIPHPTLLI